MRFMNVCILVFVAEMSVSAGDGCVNIYLYVCIFICVSVRICALVMNVQ